MARARQSIVAKGSAATKLSAGANALGAGAGGSADAASPGTTTIGADGVASDVTVLAAAERPVEGSDAGAPVATVLALVVIAGLGGAAAWRFRGRSDPAS